MKLRKFESYSALCRKSKHCGGESCILFKKGIDFKIFDMSFVFLMLWRSHGNVCYNDPTNIKTVQQNTKDPKPKQL